MHLVTSVFFLPSLMAYLKPESSVILLRSFFVTSLIVYLFRGTAALPIAEFYEKTTATPSPPGPQPTPTNKFAHGPGAPALTDKHADVWAEASKVLTPNPWYPILQTTIAHPNEHPADVLICLSRSRKDGRSLGPQLRRTRTGW